MTALIVGENEVPVPLVSQSLIIVSVIRERRTGWSSDSVSNVVLNFVNVALAHLRILADSAYI